MRKLHNFIDTHFVGCGDSTHRCRRWRHKIFAKIYPTDRRGELCSPALEIYIVDKATEGLLHLHLPQNTVTLARQRVVEVAAPYKPTSHWKHKISTAIGSPAGELSRSD